MLEEGVKRGRGVKRVGFLGVQTRGKQSQTIQSRKSRKTKEGKGQNLKLKRATHG